VGSSLLSPSQESLVGTIIEMQGACRWPGSLPEAVFPSDIAWEGLARGKKGHGRGKGALQLFPEGPRPL